MVACFDILPFGKLSHSCKENEPMKKIYSLTTVLIFLINTLAFSQMEYKPGEILIQFLANSQPENVLANYTELHDMPTGIVLDELLSKPMNIYRLKFNSETVNAPTLLKMLRADKGVSNAQFNHYVYPRETVPNDPLIGQQWHHVNDGSGGGIVDADIDTDLAWDITTGGLTAMGDTIVVCVIEGGNLLHPDLIDNAWFNHNEIPGNEIDDDSNGYIDDYRGWNVQSENDLGVYQGGHGTNVMGMIGASGNNEYGTVGANWNIKIMSVAGESLFDEASVVQAYTYPLIQRKLYNETNGANGAFVVATNASWGIDGGNPEDVPIWSAFYDTLGMHGILNCGATANNNVNIDVVGDIPTSVESDYMISVTATNRSDFRTFSGFGATTVDLGAPGENVFTASGQDGTTITSGTSFASPLTAGVIGLLYSAPCAEFAQIVHDNPQLGADYVRYVLLTGVDPVENLENETVSGGRLNAYNSLIKIMDNCAGDFCLPPFGFDYTVSNDTVFDFSWAMTEEAVAAIRFRPLGSEDWTYVENIDTTSFQIDTLAICDYYEFEIAGVCSGNAEDANYETALIVETGGCCIAPELNTASDVAETEISLNWSPDFNIPAYEVYFRVADSIDWILSGTSTSGDYLVSGLDSCTYYEILVKPTCIEGFDVGAIIYERTSGCGNCIDFEYCEAYGEDTGDEYLASVQIGDYVNESGNNGGFAIFEDTGLELDLNGNYATTLTPGFAFISYLERFKLWIDLNQDGLFGDDEILLESQTGSSDPLIGNITVPETADLGVTRLRVTMKYVGNNGSAPNACGTYSYGETEDYCVTIVLPSAVNKQSELSVFELFPNPTNGMLNLDFEPISNSTYSTYKVQILDLRGKHVFEKAVHIGENRLSPALSQGVYMLQLLGNGTDILNTEKLVITK